MIDILQFIMWGALAYLTVQHKKDLDGLSAMSAIDCLAWVATVMAIVSLAHVV